MMPSLSWHSNPGIGMKKIYAPIALLLLACASISLTAQTTTFNYTGGVQTYTVPPCVSSVNVTVLGARGGNGATAPGGLGGSVQATIPVTPGEVLNIYVGQAGIDNVGTGPTTYNGGGSVFSYSSGGTSGTGGGASDIRRTPYTTNDRLVVAGGGGGGGYQNCNGGHGGGLTGQDGIPFPSWPNAGGKGGTQATGGAGGIACCSCPTYTTSGTFAQGGNGSGDGAGGGGGGGGYYGGGGACFSGGGGGSSYTAAGVTAVIHTQGFQNGSGQVMITPGGNGAPPAPGAITGSTNFCEASSASFSISPVAGATSYTWSVPAGAVINSGQGTTSINVTFGSSSGTISVTADNVCASSAATTLAVTINATPTVTATAGSAAICNGSTTTLTGGGATTYTWMPGSLTGTVVTVNPASTTTYTVTGTSGGCSNTAMATITVNPVPTVTANTTAAVVCEGSSVTLTGNGASTYTWTGGVTDNVAFIPAATNTYTVTGIDVNGCSNTASVTVTVNPLPVVAVSFPMDTVCLSGGMVTLAGESPTGGTWSGTGVTGNMFDPMTPGVGWAMITYSFTDANSCTNSINDSLDVDICAGLITLPAYSTTIYPNPNDGIFTIGLDENVSDLVIVITDMQGRVVYSSIENSHTGHTKQISLENESSGLYFMHISVNGEERVEKISVQK
jgi:hypothetical protein